MTDLELRKRASEIVSQFRDKTVSDEEIVRQIKEEPELVHVKCLSGTNLFPDAVLWDRFPVAKTLSDMGADIHWMSEASMIHGNALGVARSPRDADDLEYIGKVFYVSALRRIKDEGLESGKKELRRISPRR